jgi:hypothetical protein
VWRLLSQELLTHLSEYGVPSEKYSNSTYCEYNRMHGLVSDMPPLSIVWTAPLQVHTWPTYIFVLAQVLKLFQSSITIFQLPLPSLKFFLVSTLWQNQVCVKEEVPSVMLMPFM